MAGHRLCQLAVQPLIGERLVSKKMGPRRRSDEGRVFWSREPQSSTSQALFDSVKQRPFRTRLGSQTRRTDAPDDIQPVSQDGAGKTLRCLDNCIQAILERPRVLLGQATVEVSGSRPSKHRFAQRTSALDLLPDGVPQRALILRGERPQQRVSHSKKPGGSRISASLSKRVWKVNALQSNERSMCMVSPSRPESRHLFLFLQKAWQVSPTLSSTNRPPDHNGHGTRPPDTCVRSFAFYSARCR